MSNPEETEKSKSSTWEIKVLDSVYGPNQVGLVATRPIMASEVICVETPVVHVASAVGSTDKEIIERHKKIFSPEGSFVAWTTPDARMEIGGRTSKPVQLAIRLIMHQELYAKKVAERALEMGYLRIFGGSASTPSVEAYDLFKTKSKKHDEEFWDLANFERLYAHVSHYKIDGPMVACSMSLGTAYCKTASLMNHSCLPNAYVKLMPNKCFIVALQDIDKGEEITRDYTTHHLLGYALPDKIRIYNRAMLGFDCKCGKCVNLPLPFGYDAGRPREYDEGFQKLFQSFVAIPKGAERLSYAMALFNNRTSMFSAKEGNKEYDILVAFKVSSMVIETIHESTGTPPNQEVAVVLEQASDIMMACTEINDWSHPIWLCRAAFARLQLCTIKLKMAIDRLREFGNEKPKKGKGSKKKSAGLDALRGEEQKRYEGDVRLHSAGFTSEYLLVKEVFSIMFGPVEGPRVLELELTLCPTTELFAKDLADVIKQAEHGMGTNAYRQAKSEALIQRYEKEHGQSVPKADSPSTQKEKKKVCKAFLLGTCKKGEKCKRFHDEALKKSLDEQDEEESEDSE